VLATAVRVGGWSSATLPGGGSRLDDASRSGSWRVILGREAALS